MLWMLGVNRVIGVLRLVEVLVIPRWSELEPSGCRLSTQVGQWSSQDAGLWRGFWEDTHDHGTPEPEPERPKGRVHALRSQPKRKKILRMEWTGGDADIDKRLIHVQALEPNAEHAVEVSGDMHPAIQVGLGGEAQRKMICPLLRKIKISGQLKIKAVFRGEILDPLSSRHPVHRTLTGQSELREFAGRGENTKFHCPAF